MWFDDWINRKWHINIHKEPIYFNKWKKVVSCESAPSFFFFFCHSKKRCSSQCEFIFVRRKRKFIWASNGTKFFQWKENRLFLSAKKKITIIFNERTYLQYFDHSPWWRKALPWQPVPVSLTVLDALDLHLGYSTACDTILPYRVIELHESVAYDPTPNHDETYTFHVLQKQFEREKIHLKKTNRFKRFRTQQVYKFNWNGNENIQARTYILIIPFHHIMSLNFTHSSWKTHTERDREREGGEIVWISLVTHHSESRGDCI